jgi:hypothetical protein
MQPQPAAYTSQVRLNSTNSEALVFLSNVYKCTLAVSECTVLDKINLLLLSSHQCESTYASHMRHTHVLLI